MSDLVRQSRAARSTPLVKGEATPPAGTNTTQSFGQSTPTAEGLNPEALVGLTKWVEASQEPIFSVLISRHGRLAYELYTSKLNRQQAHYLMSATKSVLSAVTGI